VYVRMRRKKKKETRVDVSAAFRFASRARESIADRSFADDAGCRPPRRSLRPARGLNDSAVAESTPSPLRSSSPVRPSAGAPQMGREARFARHIRANLHICADSLRYYVSLPASAVLARDRRVWRSVSWRFPFHLPRRQRRRGPARPARLPASSNAARRCELRGLPWSLPSKFLFLQRRRRDETREFQRWKAEDSPAASIGSDPGSICREIRKW